MTKTMSIGGATYDLFVRATKQISTTPDGETAFVLRLGDKLIIEDIQETCGGGASNTSVGLSRLGCDACYEGVIGSDQWGQTLLENLKQEGVDTSSVAIVEGEVTSSSIILSAEETGQRVILTNPGTNEHLHESNFNQDRIAEMDWVYLNHIAERSCHIQYNIIDILSERENLGITWNPGSCQIDLGIEHSSNKNLLKNTSALLVNREEAFAFTKKRSTEEAMKVLLGAGCKNVCITNGKHGVTASDGKSVYTCSTLVPETVVDTTGAGDAFGTGLTWALASGEDLPTALRAGTINASSVVCAMGAQAGLLTDIKMNERLQSTNLDVSVHSL